MLYHIHCSISNVYIYVYFLLVYMCICICIHVYYLNYLSIQGVIRVNFPYEEDEIIELALEEGVDSVDFIEEESDDAEEGAPPPPKAVITDTTSMLTLQEAISKKYVSIETPNRSVTADFEYIPKERMEIDDEAFELNMKLIETFEELDDVDKCYHNIA